MKRTYGLYLFYQALINILWGDEIAKAWQTYPLVSGVEKTGQTKHRAVQVAIPARPGSTTELCVLANCSVEVRALPLQHLKSLSDFFREAFLFSGITMG